jgi:hypothetical protein
LTDLIKVFGNPMLACARADARYRWLYVSAESSVRSFHCPPGASIAPTAANATNQIDQ